MQSNNPYQKSHNMRTAAMVAGAGTAGLGTWALYQRGKTSKRFAKGMQDLMKYGPKVI